MSISVTTTSKCDWCGREEIIQGAHGEVPAQSWSRLTLTTVSALPVHQGWADSRSVEWILCPNCSVSTIDFAHTKMAKIDRASLT